MRSIRVFIIALSVVFCSSVLFADTHSVVSQKPYYLTDGLSGNSYQSLKGTITMNWTDDTRYGFFNAVVKPYTPHPLDPLEYEFVLVGISQSDNYGIKGSWDVYKNGAIVCEGCVGQAYGLNQPVGQYFKLYIGDPECNDYSWHLSGFVTYRIDY